MNENLPNIETGTDGAIREFQEFSDDRYDVLERCTQFFENKDNNDQCIAVFNNNLDTVA